MIRGKINYCEDAGRYCQRACNADGDKLGQRTPRPLWKQDRGDLVPLSLAHEAMVASAEDPWMRGSEQVPIRHRLEEENAVWHIARLGHACLLRHAGIGPRAQS